MLLNSFWISYGKWKKEEGKAATHSRRRKGVGTQRGSFILSGQNRLVTCVLNPMLRLKDMSAVTKIEAKWEVQSPGSKPPSFYRRYL